MSRWVDQDSTLRLELHVLNSIATRRLAATAAAASKSGDGTEAVSSDSFEFLDLLVTQVLPLVMLKIFTPHLFKIVAQPEYRPSDKAAADPQQSSALHRAPPDALANILSFLPLQDSLPAVALVCRHLREAVASSGFICTLLGDEGFRPVLDMLLVHSAADFGSILAEGDNAERVVKYLETASRWLSEVLTPRLRAQVLEYSDPGAVDELSRVDRFVWGAVHTVPDLDRRLAALGAILQLRTRQTEQKRELGLLSHACEELLDADSVASVTLARLLGALVNTVLALHPATKAQLRVANGDRVPTIDLESLAALWTIKSRFHERLTAAHLVIVEFVAQCGGRALQAASHLQRLSACLQVLSGRQHAQPTAQHVLNRCQAFLNSVRLVQRDVDVALAERHAGGEEDTGTQRGQALYQSMRFMLRITQSSVADLQNSLSHAARLFAGIRKTLSTELHAGGSFMPTNEAVSLLSIFVERAMEALMHPEADPEVLMEVAVRATAVEARAAGEYSARDAARKARERQDDGNDDDDGSRPTPASTRSREFDDLKRRIAQSLGGAATDQAREGRLEEVRRVIQNGLGDESTSELQSRAESLRALLGARQGVPLLVESSAGAAADAGPVDTGGPQASHATATAARMQLLHAIRDTARPGQGLDARAADSTPGSTSLPVPACAPPPLPPRPQARDDRAPRKVRPTSVSHRRRRRRAHRHDRAALALRHAPRALSRIDVGPRCHTAARHGRRCRTAHAKAPFARPSGAHDTHRPTAAQVEAPHERHGVGRGAVS